MRETEREREREGSKLQMLSGELRTVGLRRGCHQRGSIKFSKLPRKEVKVEKGKTDANTMQNTSAMEHGSGFVITKRAFGDDLA